MKRMNDKTKIYEIHCFNSLNYKSKSEPLTLYGNSVRIMLTWCTRQELNLHGVNHKILSLARLPIPPRVHILKTLLIL